MTEAEILAEVRAQVRPDGLQAERWRREWSASPRQKGEGLGVGAPVKAVKGRYHSCRTAGCKVVVVSATGMFLAAVAAPAPLPPVTGTAADGTVAATATGLAAPWSDCVVVQAAEGVKRARLLRLRSRIASAHRDGFEGMAAAPPAAAAVERGQRGAAASARNISSNNSGGGTGADDSDGDEGVCNHQAVGAVTRLLVLLLEATVHLHITLPDAARLMLAYTAQHWHPSCRRECITLPHSRLRDWGFGTAHRC